MHTRQTNAAHRGESLPAGTSAQAIVPRYRFGRHDKVTIDGVAYRPVQAGDRGHAFERVDAPGVYEDFSHEALYRWQTDGLLKIRGGFFRGEAARLRGETAEVPLDEMTEEEQLSTVWRREYCVRFMMAEEEAPGAVNRSDRAMKAVIAHIAPGIDAEMLRKSANRRCGTRSETLDPPSPATLRRWLRAFADAGYQVEGLRPRYRQSGNRTPRHDAASRAFASDVAAEFADERRPTMAAVFARYEAGLDEENRVRAEHGQPPLQHVGARTFRKLLRSRLSDFEICVHREGKEAAMRKFKLVHGGLVIERPLQRVEMDEWDVGVFTVLPEDSETWEVLDAKTREALRKSRPWLTVVRDCATGCILAMRLSPEPPSTASALAGIEMAISDKSELAREVGANWEMHGVPEELAMDSGAAFVSSRTRAAVLALGAVPFYPPAGVPSMRAGVERCFGTIQRGLMHHFAGQTFSNVIERGDYDPVKKASLLLEELNRALILFADAYHDTPNKALGGETPRNAWRRAVAEYGVSPPPDPSVRRHLFGIEVQRRLTHKGVELLALHYHSLDLQRLFMEDGPQKVDVRVSRFDISEISVRPCDSKGPWFTARATRDLDLAGTTWWEWIAAWRELRTQYAKEAKVSLGAVRASMAKIRKIGAAAKQPLEIGAPILSPEHLERLETTMFRGFQIVPAAEAELPLEDILDAGDGDGDLAGAAAGQEGGPSSRRHRNSRVPGRKAGAAGDPVNGHRVQTPATGASSTFPSWNEDDGGLSADDVLSIDD
ncbi:integrase, catalytic region [Nitrospirillum viridazoti Y2]|nr:integrase, catalytic region [Nitrospirillum amazonense Y2]